MTESNTKANCHKCKYFYLTWKPSHPYGCKAFQMETKLIPLRHVYLASRQECLYFTDKSTTKESSNQ